MKTRIIFLALMIASFVTTQMAVTGAASASHNTSRGGWAGVTTLTGRTQSAMRANVSLSAQSLQTEANTLDFTTVSVCDSCSTQPIGITNKGVITGGYFDADGNAHGFLLTKKGSYVTIDVPGALFLEAGRSNSAGYVVGDYVAEDGIDRPFVRNPDGSFDLRLGFAGASATYAIDINSRGDLAGSYTLDPDGADGFTGYVMRGSTFISTFSYPGANVTNTYVLGQNESGAIVGSYKTTTEDEEHGFLRTAHGKFKQIDYPGSVQTEAFGINDAGDIVGRYTDAGGANHGFLLSDDDFTTFDSAGPNTFAWGINSKGTIVGWAFPTASDGFIGFKLLKAK